MNVIVCQWMRLQSVPAIGVAHQRQLAGVVCVAVELDRDPQFGVCGIHTSNEPAVVPDHVLEDGSRQPVSAKQPLELRLHGALRDAGERVVHPEDITQDADAVSTACPLAADEGVQLRARRELPLQRPVERHLDQSRTRDCSEPEQRLLDVGDGNAVEFGQVVGGQQCRLVDHEPGHERALPTSTGDLDQIPPTAREVPQRGRADDATPRPDPWLPSMRRGLVRATTRGLPAIR